MPEVLTNEIPVNNEMGINSLKNRDMFERIKKVVQLSQHISLRRIVKSDYSISILIKNTLRLRSSTQIVGYYPFPLNKVRLMTSLTKLKAFIKLNFSGV